MVLLRRAARHWLPAAAAGIALGALGWIVAREAAERGAEADGARMELSGLRSRLRAAGAAGVDARSLAPGIVELVGRVDDRERIDRFLALASATPGVEVVVNRLWSPAGEVSRAGAGRPEAAGEAELT